MPVRPSLGLLVLLIPFFFVVVVALGGFLDSGVLVGYGGLGGIHVTFLKC